ncbi:MAG: amino acid permease [Candidatus Wildermuthbacteria bacterium]|nr:amino acid permease [Candidatus Wildermuthbacteria bacterium]
MKRILSNPFLLALSTLVGTIVGAGIFGLPYVVAKSGIIAGVFYFVLLGGVVMILHLMFGEIALRTKEKHRLIGYASLYLGGWAKKLVTVSTIVGSVGALLAYIIIGGDFLYIALGSFIPLSSFAFAVVLWFVLSLFILRGIQAIAKTELLMDIILFIVVGVIFVFTLPHFQLQNFMLFNSSFVFLPYGVVLFSFLGLSAIPEIAELFKHTSEKRSLDNLIVWSSVICGGLFFAFTLFVVGVSGAATSQDALSGLIPLLGEKVVVLGAVFGLVAIAGSFLVLGNYLKNSLRYDYKVPYGISVAVAIFSPILLFLLGLREFIFVIGVVGALVAALEGSVIALIYRTIKEKGDREPEYSIRIPRPILFGAAVLLVLGALLKFFAFPFLNL